MICHFVASILIGLNGPPVVYKMAWGKLVAVESDNGAFARVA